MFFFVFWLFFVFVSCFDLEASCLYRYTRNTKHETRNTKHETRNTKHETRNTKHETRNTKHETRNTKHETRNTKHETRNTKHETRNTSFSCFVFPTLDWMNEIFEWVQSLNMPKGNEVLLPSTVEWHSINNDSAILRLIVFTESLRLLHDRSPTNDLLLNDRHLLNVVYDYDSLQMFLLILTSRVALSSSNGTLEMAGMK